jgi:hypothetical protein
VTVTCTVPTDSAGDLTVMEEAVAPVRFLPLIVTFVFPANGPEGGLSDLRIGADGLAATVSTMFLMFTVVEPITERENL